MFDGDWVALHGVNQVRTPDKEDDMGIGASIFMIALGAIITFGFNVTIGWLDLDVVGWVLMAAGALGLIMTLVVLSNRRRTVVNSPPDVEDSGVVRERTTSYEDRPL